MPTSKLTLVNQSLQRTPTTLSAAQTPLNQRALNTLQAVRAWEQFEQRLSNDDRALLDRVAMGDCIKSASNHVGMTYANAQRRLLRLQERMGVRSLPLLIWVWRTVTQPDHAGHAEQAARDTTPTLVEHARDVARFVKSKPEHHDTDALHNANINNDDLITLLESRMRDGDTAAMSEFVVSVSMSLPSLLSSSEADFEMAVRAARVIAAMEKPEPVGIAINVLLDVCRTYISRADPSQGMSLVERAIELAATDEFKSELRRACNIRGALATLGGNTLVGVESAFSAALLASELGQHVNIAAALANMTASLLTTGMYREAVAVAILVVRDFGSHHDCVSFVASARTNMASAALALNEYAVAFEAARDACEQMGLPTDKQAVLDRIIAEGVFLKTAIGLKQNDVIEKCLKLMRSLAASFKAPRIDLNLNLAEAAVEIYSGDLTVAVVRLLALKEQTKLMSGLHHDNLMLLIAAYEKGGNQTGVLQYSCELAELFVASQITKVRGLLRAVHEYAQPQKPVSHNVRTIVEEIQTPTPRKSLTHIEVPESMYRETFERLALSAELRDDIDTENLGRHAYRVGALTGLLAARAGHDDHFVQSVELSARLHDVGKLCIPENILTKTEKLTSAEFAANSTPHVGRRTNFVAMPTSRISIGGNHRTLSP
jgi:putative two-component system response regulator